ncbi:MULTISPECIES: beta-ketoacyl synthase N-terminal-like domain-containing protein [Chryseobacterium]|uniref:3-oxoacyl-(Acyl-carrier-protein) synthase n=1 Tax=Chryseobacterium camelliae TaxID=1265445 RepID=A0ABU0TNN8_9FLAO|nr:MULTISPECIES: beta-ketoacyl synthase N-terminal-like domain-containing protein [Chryseobacterium]MDT3408221.1 3-oxoacyl-(acyl-carrier-protein) synthase [Pseudacidovorax intermedius]MDQ1097925.1 3-oxoacyl-(acyl-carrier-protein) synthase [Chryseobacterium camelliae]MDQ1101856.1 3-oxoacyl-(acyl-carrier-protein) synthase [Chryseobacterium sp. SORGH_AS_1048]MDR6085296.1 3-oxoacyl-(acyl-carrier-protein) synthase [Chryseobacterium sp. SORGH_AS_0909]MDR6129653.1 3-oxoacyl-(acyl-carrier-protein) syn
MSSVYINSAACISAQETLKEGFMNHLQLQNAEQILQAIEPNYKEFIPPAMIRRMSKTVKMSTVAAHYALKEAGIDQPDAIIVGTGMGCCQDSEKFLKNVIDNHEEFLTPTYFIQSTHNTVAGQITLGIQCHAYNFTYVNTSSALEFSFLDAKLQINDGEAENILTGSTDEKTDRVMELHRLNGSLKKEENLPADHLHSDTDGVTWGEGASFFVLGKSKSESTYAELKDIKIINTLKAEETSEFITQFLAQNHIGPHDIDAVILGFSGDAASDIFYTEAVKIFPDSALLYYKHLSGEFNTSSGFSVFMACHILKEQLIPEIMRINTVPKNGIKNVLLYNHLKGHDHSLMLLQKADS